MLCGRPGRARDAQGPALAANLQSAGADWHSLRLRLPNHFLPPASRGLVPTAMVLVKANSLAGASYCGQGRLRAQRARLPAPNARCPTALFRWLTYGTSATERD